MIAKNMRKRLAVRHVVNRPGGGDGPFRRVLKAPSDGSVVGPS